MFRSLCSISCLLLLVASACSDDTSIGPDSGPRSDGSNVVDGPGVFGDAGPSACPPGEQAFEPGCAGPENYLNVAAGCYRLCSGEDDQSCGADKACRAAWVNPCVCDPTPGVSCCAACGASEWLCISKTLPYPLDAISDTCDGKFSGQDLLDSLQSSYAATFTYANDATSALTLTVGYSGGNITCHPEVPAPPGTKVADQPARIELPVTLTFVTDDGQFNESFDTVLDGQLGMASFSQERSTYTIAGTYDPPASEQKISYGGTLLSDGTNGFVRVYDDGSGGGVINVGGWTTTAR